MQRTHPAGFAGWPSLFQTAQKNPPRCQFCGESFPCRLYWGSAGLPGFAGNSQICSRYFFGGGFPPQFSWKIRYIWEAEICLESTDMVFFGYAFSLDRPKCTPLFLATSKTILKHLNPGVNFMRPEIVFCNTLNYQCQLMNTQATANDLYYFLFVFVSFFLLTKRSIPVWGTKSFLLACLTSLLWSAFRIFLHQIALRFSILIYSSTKLCYWTPSRLHCISNSVSPLY